MSSQKKIEINQSSLLGLKAELLRKKNEVSTAKYSQQLTNTKFIKKKLTTKFDKLNEGVSEREQRDAEEIQQEADELKKSQRILEEKAKLYEKLTTKSLGGNTDVDSSNFLVNFKEKANEEAREARAEAESENVESEYSDFSEDEDEWVDFVDCLGRTKRCHRDDLQAMKEQDEKLKTSLFGESKPVEREKERETDRLGVDSVQLPQLCSDDMKREILRQKWEEQERHLLDKKNVHYQDVLFDEARTHGVGYYEFSTDETERLRQQEELKKLRKETEEQQAETQTIAQKKQKQMEERLKAARRRKRERLGLPLEEEPEVPEVKEEEEKKPEPPEPLRRDVRKPGPLRPWDIGKEGKARVLSQEEWVEKKRAERHEEFAPPTFPNRKKFKRNVREESPPSPPRQRPIMQPTPIQDELEVEEVEETRGRGAEIPPPPTFEMYGPSSVRKRSMRGSSQAEIDRSIEEGLEFLKRKAEAKKARRPVDEDDIM